MVDGVSKFKTKKQTGKKIGNPSQDDANSIGLPSSPLNIMYRGYFPLWRKIRDWGWYKDSNTKAVFLELLLLANFKKKDYLGHIVNPGQCVVGRKSLSASLGLSERQIRTSLKRLIATNELTIKTTNKFSIITLNNFNKYTKNDQPSAPLTTNKRPDNDQQTTTTYNDNNDNNDKKSSRFAPPPLLAITEYCKERKNKVDPEKWFDFYSAKGWMIGRNKMKDWRAAVRTWEKKEVGFTLLKRPVQIVLLELRAQKYEPDAIKQKLLMEGYSEREIDVVLGKKY